MRKKFLIFWETWLFDTERFEERGRPLKVRFSVVPVTAEPEVDEVLNSCVMVREEWEEYSMKTARRGAEEE
jgi:hypothetical protein